MDSISVSKPLLALLLLFAIIAPISVVFGVDGQNAAASAIDKAEMVLASSYEVVLATEEAGANVSGLLFELNHAGELLAEARIVNRSGDFDKAVNLADLCSQIGQAVESDAFQLRLEAEGRQVSVLLVALVGSVVGVVAVLIAGFFGWSYVRKRYVRRVLEMKPEVNKGDEHQ